MTTTKDLRVFIGATDFGPLGADLVQSLSTGRGGPDRIALADLGLIAEGGGGYAILNRQEVRAYEWTSTNHNPSTGYISAIYFNGFVNLPGTGRAPGSTLKTWKVSAQDLNIQKIRLVSPAANALAWDIAAAHFDAQIFDLFSQAQSGASLIFDSVTRVLNLTGSTTLPRVILPGKSLLHYMDAIIANAVAADPALRPVWRLAPDSTVGSAITFWQQPQVYVWDDASPPSAVLTLDDATAGDVLAREGYQRVLDSTDQVTARQNYRKDTGRVYTYIHPTATVTWPNPCDFHGAWWEEAFESKATTNTDQENELIADVNGTAYPRETLDLTTPRTPPPEGSQYLALTLALEGLAGDLYAVAGGDTTFTRRRAAATDSPFLQTSHLTLGLPRTLLGQRGGGSTRPPATAVPPDVPLHLAVTGNVFDWGTGTSLITYAWDPPANPAGVVGYRLNVTVPAGTFQHDIDFAGIYSFTDRLLHPGEAFSTTIQSKGLNGLLSVESAPVTGTAATRPSPPTAPGSFAQTNAFDPNRGNTAVTYTWTASTPGSGCTIDHYEIDVQTPNPGGPHYLHNAGVGLSYIDHMNPNATARAVVRAYDNHGQVSADSSAVTFTSADFYAPDAPSALTILARGIGGGGALDRPAPTAAWARIGFTPPGTSHGPHDYYLTRWATSGEPVQTNRILGTDTSFIIYGIPGRTYSASIQTFSNPAWPGGTATISVTLLALPSNDSFAQPDAPLFPYDQTAGSGAVTVDSADPFAGAGAYAFTSSGADTQTLTGLPFAVTEGQTWVVRTAAKKSGGAPTFTGAVQWDDGSDTWALTASTLTLPALTTSWPSSYTEEQVVGPSTAKFGRRVVTATFAAALTILASLPQPTPAASVADTKFVTSSTGALPFYDSTGVLRGSIFIDGTGAPIAFRLHTLNTGGGSANEVGTRLDSTYGDDFQVGDLAAGGGITGTGASGKAINFGVDGQSLLLDASGLAITGAVHGLTLDAALAVPRRSVNSSTTLTDSDAVLLASKGLGALTVTLPAASGRDGRVYWVWRTDAGGGTISLAADGSDTINGAASVTLTAGQLAWVLQLSGTTWLAKIW